MDRISSFFCILTYAIIYDSMYRLLFQAVYLVGHVEF